MKVIALFSDKSRVGKDSVGNLLAGRLAADGYSVQILKVADHLKRVSHFIFKGVGVLTGEDYEKHPERRDSPLICPLTNNVLESDVVDIWIAIGEAVKSQWKHAWIFHTINDLRDLAEVGVDFAIITDCRENFEIEALQKEFSTLVVEVKSDNRGTVRAMDGKVTLSPDVLIPNNGTLAELTNSPALEAAYKAAVAL